MRTVTFYRFSLLLPLATPIVAAAFIWMVPIDTVAPLNVILILSLTYGGVPYVVGMTGLQLWLRRRNAREIGHASYWVPVALFSFGCGCFCWRVPGWGLDTRTSR